VLFAIIAEDKPNGVEHRMAVRPAHLAHLKTVGDKLVFAGPLLDAASQPCGSLMVIEADDQAEAEAMAKRDPFVREGVFESYQVRRWSWGINNPTGRGQ
jgi:uncharacterized protein YciI